MTRRNLLEWTAASQTKASLDLGLGGFYRQMSGGLAVAGVAAALVLVLNPGAAPVVFPFVTLWLLSPLIANWVSTPPAEQDGRQLSAADAATLRLIARRTWRFFETFVGPDDHALPPDNFQEDPQPVIAHRTSPTNIGMYLLSVVTARDLGWIGTLEMVERLEATLATIGSMQGFHGHLYNWYETRDLRALEPLYVSSVDSGNLCGALLTVANACQEMLDRPLPVEAALAGIDDAIHLTRAAATGIGDERRTQTVSRRQLDEALASFEPSRTVPVTLEAWAAAPRGARGPDRDAGRCRRRADRRARGWPRDRSRELGRCGPSCRREPRPGSRALGVGRRDERDRRTARRRWDAAAGARRDVRRGVAGRDRRCDGRRRRSRGGSRASRTAPSSSSATRTSASCTTRRASCSRSGTASWTGRWTRATTTCWPRRPGSRASSPSPRATSPLTTGSSSAAR